jgi:hypothetical protein
MGNASGWQRISSVIACCIVAACGGASGGSGPSSSPADFDSDPPQVVGGTPPIFTANVAPTISGTPSPSAIAGIAYEFVPQAVDPEGHALTFSVAGRPAWASFDALTGRLWGTPTSSDVGTHGGIVISVSDGVASAALATFTIQVTASTSYRAATISWAPPTTNTDNSPLTNLSGYRIYYGTSASNLTQVLDLPNPGISSGVVENLAAGKWYFAVTSYNSSNVESERSNVTSKTIG